MCCLGPLVGLSGCGSGVVVNTITTTVAPLETEDLRSPCVYEIPLQIDPAPQVAVLVIFQRGNDSRDLFQDTSVREMASALHVTVMYAHECDAKSFGDLQPDATKGPGRAMFAALDQFATTTAHPELGHVPVIPFGFSAAGALTLTLTHAYPDRVLGTIPYAAGSSTVKLADLPISATDAAIPMLMLENAEDQITGTTRAYAYFDRGRALGARWGFAVQNESLHCCTMSTRGVIVPWIAAMVNGAGALSNAGVRSYFSCVRDGGLDDGGQTDCRIEGASITGASPTATDTGWLPDATTAEAWLAWVTNSRMN